MRLVGMFNDLMITLRSLQGGPEPWRHSPCNTKAGRFAKPMPSGQAMPGTGVSRCDAMSEAE